MAGQELNSPAAPQPVRYPSLDAFRGVVIVSMLLVNAIRGRDFAPETFHHADWRVGPLHSTFADLVAPWFLLAVGLALPFSMHYGRGKDAPFLRKVLVAARRMTLLFIIGGLIEVARVVTYEPVTWRTMISVDVLPQIGIAYFAALFLYHGPAWSRPVFIVLVFLSKEVLLAHWPHPEVGHPVWTAGQNMQDYLRARFPLFKGFHGAMVAACIVCIGTYWGDRLRRAGPAARNAITLVVAGGIMVLLSWLWAFDLPYSRYYHTPTWALLAAGTGSAMLGVVHGSIDTRWGRWLNLLVPLGRNPIAVYILAELLWPLIDPAHRFKLAHPDRTYPWDALEHLLARVVGEAAAPWLQVSLYLAAFWALALVLQRKRLFLKL